MSGVDLNQEVLLAAKSNQETKAYQMVNSLEKDYLNDQILESDLISAPVKI